MHKILKFLVSGGLAAATEYGVFALMQAAELSLFFAQTSSFLCGFVVSFSMNRQWVFKSKGQMRKQLIQYGALASVNLVLTNVLMSVFVYTLHINNLVAKIIMMAMVAVWNYVIFSKLIFGHTKIEKSKVKKLAK